MDHNTAVIVTAAIAIAGVLWTAFWIWVGYMAFRLVRWAYVEKRDLRRAAAPANGLPTAQQLVAADRAATTGWR